jgi:hypothetical protein
MSSEVDHKYLRITQTPSKKYNLIGLQTTGLTKQMITDNEIPAFNLNTSGTVYSVLQIL